MWQEHAACAGAPDPEVFFRDDDPADAFAVCARCPVTAECADWATRQPWPGFTGIAGGRLWVRGQPPSRAQLNRRHAQHRRATHGR